MMHAHRRIESRIAAGALTAVTLIGIVLSIPALAAEPEGFGKAKFGMSPEQAKTALPKMKPTEEDLGAAVVGGPRVKRFVLRKYAVPGLEHPTDVELRFWDDKLWVVVVYFGKNDYQSVNKALEKELGPTGHGDDKSRVWIGEKTTSVASDREKYYSISDNDLSTVARAAIFQGAHHSAPPTPDRKTAASPSSPPATPKATPATPGAP